MGQKSSKKQDLYVTEDVTHCNLPDEDVWKYSGRAREYTAADVIVEKPEETDTTGETKNNSPSHGNPRSVIELLQVAHRQNYHLAFIVPKVKGSKPTALNRDSLVIEENDDEKNEMLGEMTHTIFLWRPKVRSQVKKERSLRRMEAKKTFLNVMMDIQHKWVFSVKDFVQDVSKIESGEYLQKLQEMLSNEASEGGRLLSVMKVEADEVKKNGLANGEARSDDATDGADEGHAPQRNAALRLRMIFLRHNVDGARQRFLYDVKCVNMNCTEQKIKVKKKQKVKPSRDTNITWSENWLDLPEESSRITEVVNIGELSRPDAESTPQKAKKLKKRNFQVVTLVFLEKPVTPDDDDNDDEDDGGKSPKAYDALVREVWAPIDDNVQENLEAEAEKYGKSGWELCTVLVTSHVRMKPGDGKEFRKCAFFFQRPKTEFIPKAEKDHSTENLIQEGNVTIEETNEPQTELLEGDELPPTTPRNKVEKFGVAMLPTVNLDQAKLRATKSSPQKSKPAESIVSGIAHVQLKKVDRDKIKKPELEQEKTGGALTQVKLRRTEPKTASERTASGDQEAPWAESLERKRMAALKADEKIKPSEEPKEKSEAEKKLEEIKVKRAQRQKRLSLHREEEKRKSLHEQAAPAVLAVEEVQTKTVAVDIDAVQSSTDNSLPPPPDQIPEAQEDVEANIDDSNKYEETVSDVAFPGTPAVVADEKKDTDAADNSLPPPPDQIPEVQEDVEANTDDSNKYEETVSDVAFPGTPAVVADEKKDADAVQSSTDNSLPPPIEDIPEAEEGGVEANTEETIQLERSGPETPAVVVDETLQVEKGTLEEPTGANDGNSCSDVTESTLQEPKNEPEPMPDTAESGDAKKSELENSLTLDLTSTLPSPPIMEEDDRASALSVLHLPSPPPPESEEVSPPLNDDARSDITRTESDDSIGSDVKVLNDASSDVDERQQIIDKHSTDSETSKALDCGNEAFGGDVLSEATPQKMVGTDLSSVAPDLPPNESIHDENNLDLSQSDLHTDANHAAKVNVSNSNAVVISDDAEKADEPSSSLDSNPRQEKQITDLDHPSTPPPSPAGQHLPSRVKTEPDTIILAELDEVMELPPPNFDKNDPLNTSNVPNVSDEQLTGDKFDFPSPPPIAGQQCESSSKT